MARRRARLVDTVTDRTMLAYLAGFRAGKDGKAYDRARLDVLDNPDGHLHIDEQVAYAQLLPATWWSAFGRGWHCGAAAHLSGAAS